MNRQQRRNAAILTATLFALLFTSMSAPVAITFTSLELIENKPVIQAGCLEVTTNDILTGFSLLAGSATLATFAVTVIPIFKKRKIL